MKAHPTAQIDPAAVLADDVEVGPFCVVGPKARVGPGCRLGPRVLIHGEVRVGRDNIFHPHVSIGSPGGGRIEIGDGNVFRELSNVHPPAAADAVTTIGSRNRLGTWAVVGGGSRVGDDTRLGTFSALAEGCIVENEAWIEPQCVVEAGIRIGAGSLTRSQTPVCIDVPPYMCLDSNPAEIQGPNPLRPGPRGATP